MCWVSNNTDIEERKTKGTVRPQVGLWSLKGTQLIVDVGWGAAIDDAAASVADSFEDQDEKQ